MNSFNLIYILPIYWPAIGGCEIHTRELVKRIGTHHQVKVITQVDSQNQKLKARKGRPSNNWFVTTVWAPSKERIFIDHQATVHRLGLNIFEKIPAYAAVRFHPSAEALTMKVLTTLFKRKIFPLTAGADLIHCIHGGVSYLGLTALQIARQRRIPFVYTPVAHLFPPQDLHGPLSQPPLTPRFPTLSYKPREWLDRFWFDLCQQADALITMTHYEKAFFQEKGIKEEKIFPVGVGPILSAKGDGKTFRQKYGLDKKKMILFLGRKHESKGIVHLLEAAQFVWQKYAEVYFFFIGPVEGRAKALFERYRDRRIVEIGFVDEQEKANALEACDIFCLPSTEESLGGVFLEAWMCEKPIIAADIPPLRELTENGEGGCLVYPHPKTIAEQILFLLEREDVRLKMGRWGKERVLAYYNWDRIDRQMAEIYKMLISQRRRVY